MAQAVLADRGAAADHCGVRCGEDVAVIEEPDRVKLFMNGVRLPVAGIELDVPAPPPAYDEAARRWRDRSGRFVPAWTSLQILGPSFFRVELGSPFPIEIGERARWSLLADDKGIAFDAIATFVSDRKIELRLCGECVALAV